MAKKFEGKFLGKQLQDVFFWLLFFFLLPSKVFAVQTSLPAFPGAEGFGVNTPGGSGRNLPTPNATVHKVTNLNASGAGSLKACTDSSGPRVCVFEISGTIVFTSDLSITNPYLTIAGQTAPSPGIMIRGAALTVLTHDVLVQHVRFRAGDGVSGPSVDNRDSMKLDNNRGSVGSPEMYDVVLDHCSISWGVDETISVWQPGANNVTVSNSIISESLYATSHPESPHSMGAISGPETSEIAWIKNLFAHNNERNPRSKSDSLLVVNNLVYNRGSRDVDIGGNTSGHPEMATIVGNVFIKGPNFSSNNYSVYLRTSEMPSGSGVYESGNDCSSYTTGSCHNSSSYIVPSPPVAVPGNVQVFPSSQVESRVLTAAGAWPANRDQVDSRVVSEVQSRSGEMKDCVSGCARNAGGWPSYAQNTRTLDVPNNHNGDSDGDGYTNLENWLFCYLEDAEGVDNSGCGSPVCGDGTCNEAETCANCEADCAICPTTYGLSDFLALLQDWLIPGTTQTDVNQDGIVNARDLGIMMSGWGD